MNGSGRNRRGRQPERRRGAGNRTHCRGMTRAAGILLTLICVMLVVILVPMTLSWFRDSAEYGCSLALEKAQDYVDFYYLTHDYSVTLAEAEEEVRRSLIAREEACPDGGEFFIFESPKRDNPYMVCCGLHDSDQMRRTRLCARHVLERIQAAVERRQKLGEQYPESVTVSLNSRELVCPLIREDVDLKRGTGSTRGYEGTVVFYGLKGAGELGLDDDRDGTVCWFVFADENHCARWDSRVGWYGDCF